MKPKRLLNETELGCVVIANFKRIVGQVLLAGVLKFDMFFQPTQKIIAIDQLEAQLSACSLC
jgi:hypothetical protein